MAAESLSCAKCEFRQMLANANDTPDIDELAGMLTRGEFPENYDHIIRNISDDDLERLWAVFHRMRLVMSPTHD